MTLVGSAALAEQAGLTYRQIDYWVRSDRLRTSKWDGTRNPGEGAGTGRERMFAPTEVFVATTVAQLLRAGFHLGPAFELARELANGRAVLTLAPGLRLHHVAGYQKRPARCEVPGQVDIYEALREA